MEADRLRWNQKYESGDFPRTPSRIVQQFLPLAPLGRALDIASGSGRNAVFLAQAGFMVDAMDISDRGLSVVEKHPNVTAACVDFDVFDIPMDRYSLILNIRFLNRRLYPQIIEGLTDGGVLIFETYLVGGDVAQQEGHRREYMLRPNELIYSFLPLRIIHYRETLSVDSDEGRPLASIVAAKGRPI